jgi:hypothetical protein
MTGVMQEILTRKRPFDDIRKDVSVIFAVANGSLPTVPDRLEDRPACDRILWNLCKRCWVQNPLLRPIMRDIVADILRDSFGSQSTALDKATNIVTSIGIFDMTQIRTNRAGKAFADAEKENERCFKACGLHRRPKRSIGLTPDLVTSIAPGCDGHSDEISWYQTEVTYLDVRLRTARTEVGIGFTCCVYKDMRCISTQCFKFLSVKIPLPWSYNFQVRERELKIIVLLIPNADSNWNDIWGVLYPQASGSSGSSSPASVAKLLVLYASISSTIVVRSLCHCGNVLWFTGCSLQLGGRSSACFLRAFKKKLCDSSISYHYTTHRCLANFFLASLFWFILCIYLAVQQVSNQSQKFLSCCLLSTMRSWKSMSFSCWRTKISYNPRRVNRTYYICPTSPDWWTPGLTWI